MEIPKDRRKLNAWCRYFFDSEPLVHSALTLHTEFPLSGIYIEHPDPEIKEFLDQMIDHIDLFEIMMNAALEFWVTGEAYPCGVFDDPDDPMMWDRFVLLDPDFIDVYSVPWAQGDASLKINMLPNPMLARVVENGPLDPNTGEIYQHLPADVIGYIRASQPMPLDPLCVSQIKHLSNPHNERGTPLLLSCCLPGTPIWMADGRVIPVECVQADMQLTSQDGTPNTVLDVGVREVREDIGVIKFEGNNQPLRLTLEDKLLVTKKEQTRCRRRKTQDVVCIPGIEYKLGKDKRYPNAGPQTHNCSNDVTPSMVSVSEIKPGDYVVTPYPERNIDDKDWTSGKARLLGYYLAEGWYYKYEQWNCAYTEWCISEKEIADDILRLAKQEFGLDGYFTVGTQRASVPLYHPRVSSVKLAEWFATHGSKYAKQKQLSAEVMGLSDELLLQLLAGFIDGDGTVVNDHFKLITASEQMAWQLYTICLLLKMHPRIQKRDVQPNKMSDKISTVYWILLNQPDSRRIPAMPQKYNKLGIEHSEGKRTAHNLFWHDNYLYHKVISAEKEYYEGTVHPIHTDGSHTYVANGLIKSNCFKLLMYRDKLRESQYMIADRHVTPKEFYMIGETGDPASDEELQAFKSILQATWTQPNQAIIYHHALRVEWQGASGKILPLQAEFDDIEKHVLAGLMTSRAFLHGEGPSYSSSSIALDVLIQRYLFFRKQMERWLLKSVFGPILKIHGMYKPEKSQLNNRYRIRNMPRQLWYPEIIWEKQNLRDDVQRSQLLQALYDKGLIPASHVLKYHNIDPEMAMRGIEKERGTVFDKSAPQADGGIPMPPGDFGGGMGDLGSLPPMPEGAMPTPSQGGLEMPSAGFGGEDMSSLPIGSPGGGSKSPESISSPNLPLG